MAHAITRPQALAPPADPKGAEVEVKEAKESEAKKEPGVSAGVKKNYKKKEITLAKTDADDWFQQELKKSAKEAKEQAEARVREREEAAARAEDLRMAEERAREAREAAEERERIAREAEEAEAVAEAALFKNCEHAPNYKPVTDIDFPCPVPPQVTESAWDDKPPPPEVVMKKKKILIGELPEYYKLLGLDDFDASREEVKKGFRNQAREWHPDKNRHRLEEATAMFAKINEAFDTLYDPVRREQYDSGSQPATESKLKKLGGYGWASIDDNADEALTKQGWKWKRGAWRAYVMNYGRIDDNPEDFVDDDNDPRAPAMKIKVFWRLLGEYAYIDKQNKEPDWLNAFVAKVWKDTPSRWPKAVELANMNEAQQEEWKERRMVFNRRRSKMQVQMEMHEAYLRIPGREQKEKARLLKMNPVRAASLFAKDADLHDRKFGSAMGDFENAEKTEVKRQEIEVGLVKEMPLL